MAKIDKDFDLEDWIKRNLKTVKNNSKKLNYDKLTEQQEIALIRDILLLNTRIEEYSKP